MNIKGFVIFWFILIVFGGDVVRAQNTSKSRDVHVVLLAGQSNMAGAGNYDELDKATKQRIKKASHNVYLSFNGKPAQPLSYYKNKRSEKYDFKKRFGPELMLGVTLAEANPNQKYLLIKRSQGGTSLYGAWNPNWTSEKAKALEKGDLKQNIKLYELHISDIRKNIEVLKNQNETYNIIGLAWMQGENDAINEEAAKSYRNSLKELIKAYRTDFDTPKLPIVLGQINSRYGIDGGAELVRKNMKRFIYQDYYSKLIETSTDTSWSDFPKHKDNVHYNTEGQERLGVAFAKGFFDIQNKLDVDPFQNVSQLKPESTIKIKAKGATNMFYHVYTPSNFKESEKQPIIIAFSPAGNGLGILNAMKGAAESSGWLLVGCDKLKNGMDDEDLERKMEDEVLDDILKNIPHDDARIYLAGFSGGAMRAYQLSTRRAEHYAGIIAYGGWLGGNDYQDKVYQQNMHVAIINGLNDKGANNWKAIDTKTLEKNNCVVKQFEHAGGHQVAPQESTFSAMSWLEKSWQEAD